jgi:asparagine synthase (glutamine-hydrolysing)
VTYYTEDMRSELYTQETRRQMEEEESCAFLKTLFQKARRRERHDFFDQMTAVDLQSFLPCNLLAYTDRMSMAHALEVRVPFTDHKLVEFVTRLPSALRLKGMQDKYILKRAVGHLLPESILNRKKLGFNPPMALWLKEDLEDLVKDCLSETAIKRRGYFQYEAIRALLGAHASGKRDMSLHIWALLVLEVWHRMYIKS